MNRGVQRRVRWELRALLSHEWAARRNPKQQRVLLQVEELESRALLSASGVTAEAVVQPAKLPDNLTAHTNYVVRPADDPSSFGGFTPLQFQQAYGINNIPSVNGTPINGAGETIAVIDAYNDPTIGADANAFSAKFNLPGFVNQPNSPTTSGPTLTVSTAGNGPPWTLPEDPGWAREESLDVEWAHAVAPQANILVVEAPDAGLSLYQAAQWAASQPGVVAVSMSFGMNEVPGLGKLLDPYFQKAPNVTFLASSGDNSAVDPISGQPATSYPSTSPDVIAVGGTSLHTVTGSNGQAVWQYETGWNDGGGGYSSLYSQPSFQSGVVPSGNVQNSGVRMAPDVSMDANPDTGELVYSSFAFGDQQPLQVVGGTSASSPEWAGIIALADQMRRLNGGTALDNYQVETTLYSTLQNPTLYKEVFHSITHGPNGYAAGDGYNLVGGLGSPIANSLVPFLANTSVQGQTITSTTAGGGSFSGTAGAGHSGGHKPGSMLNDHPMSGVLTIAASPIVSTSQGNDSMAQAAANSNAAANPTLMVSSPLTLKLTTPSNGNSSFLLPFNLGGQGASSGLAGVSNLFGPASTSSATNGTVFGASGWNGPGNSWRLDGYGMHGPQVDQVAGDLATSRLGEQESQPEAAPPEGQDAIVPEATVTEVAASVEEEGE